MKKNVVTREKKKFIREHFRASNIELRAVQKWQTVRKNRAIFFANMKITFAPMSDDTQLLHFELLRLR